MSFATAKIQAPRLRIVRVERPALDAAITEALLDRRVVLLQAPAGFGKTSALAAQLARMPARSALAWVSLDEDDDPERLFSCLVAALEPHDLPWRTAPEALAAQVGSDGPGRRRAITELLNALADADAPRGLIVLDDLHRVQSADTHALIDALIERLPANWTLVLSTRVAPPLALARLRVTGELAEFNQDDLRFNAAEAAALAAADETQQARDRVAELFERTQGWPAGLRLCLAALRTRPGSAGTLAVRSAGLVDRHLFDYLASEVLDDMPAPLHDFLARCSVLSELTVARAIAVSGDPQAAERMDEIEQRGLFVTALEASERTLVLHDLFRDALQERLRRRFPAEWPLLLRRAAEGETDPLRKVGFLLRAEDWAAAEAALAQSAPELFLQGGVGEVQRLVEQFPADTRAASPPLLRLAGIGHCLRWQWSEMARCMQAAAEAARARGDVAERQLAEAYLASACNPLGRHDEGAALLAGLRGETLAAPARLITQLCECSQHILRGEHDKVPAAYALLLDTLEREGSLYNWWECAPAPAWSTLRGLRPVLQRYQSGALARLGDRALPMRGEVRIHRAFTYLWAGEIESALADLRIAEGDMKWLACSADAEVSMRFFQLLFDAMRGDAPAVEAQLQALFIREEGASEERRRVWHHQVAIYGVRTAGVLGLDGAAVERWARLLNDQPLTSSVDTRRANAVRARYAAAQQRWTDAAALFSALLPEAAQMDINGQAVELHLRAAQALLRCGRPLDAARAVAPALERMRIEGERGHALMAGAAVLSELAGTRWGAALSPENLGELRAAAGLAGELRAAPAAKGVGAVVAASAAVSTAPPAAASIAPTLSDDDELLTAREREVLELIGAGESNKLIARALDISPHTVKRHVANILDKLGLASRGQAGAWLHEHGHKGVAMS